MLLPTINCEEHINRYQWKACELGAQVSAAMMAALLGQGLGGYANENELSL